MSQVVVTPKHGSKCVQVDAGAGDETVTLPSWPLRATGVPGYMSGQCSVVRVDSSVHTVTVRPPTGWTLNGAVDGTSTVPAATSTTFSLVGHGVWAGGAGIQDGVIGTSDLAAFAVTAGKTSAGVQASLGLADTAARPLVPEAISTTLTNLTLTVNHLARIDCTAGNAARTLPSAASAGAGGQVGVRQTDTGGNGVTVSPAGADTINNVAAARVLAAPERALTFVSDGAANWSVSSTDTPKTALDARYAGPPGSTLHRPAMGRWDVDRMFGSQVMATPPSITVQGSGAYTGFITSPSHFTVAGGSASGQVWNLHPDSNLPSTPIPGAHSVPIRMKGGTPISYSGGGLTLLAPNYTNSGVLAPNTHILEIGHYGTRIAFGVRAQSFVSMLFRVDGKYVSLTPTNPGTDATLHFVTLNFETTATITGVTTANPGVVTCSADHGLASGDVVKIAGCVGATQANGLWAVTVLSSTTFSIPVNVTGTWSSGGTATGGYAARTIELIGTMVFEGIEVGPTDSLWLPPRPRRPLWFVLGDSFFYGSLAYNQYGGMINQIMRRLGVDDCVIDAAGGTGVLKTNGSSNNYVDRLNAGHVTGLTSTPDAFLLGGSINDDSFTSAQVQAQATLALNLIAAQAPGAPVFVTVFANLYPVSAGQAGVLAAWQAAAAGRSNVFIISVQDALTGIGWSTAPTGTGTSDMLIGNDHTHPTQPGHDYYARRIAQEIQAVMPALAG